MELHEIEKSRDMVRWMKKYVKKQDAEVQWLREQIMQMKGEHVNHQKEVYDKLPQMVLDAVEKDMHPLLKMTDLIYCCDLSRILHLIYPDEPRFQVPPTDYGYDINLAARRLGGMIGTAKIFPKLYTRLYVPASKQDGTKRATYNLNVWVLRNFDKYKDIPPTELYRVHKTMWGDAARKFKADEKAEAAKLDSEPSFL